MDLFKSFDFSAIGVIVIITKLYLRPFKTVTLNIQDMIYEMVLLTITIIFANFRKTDTELKTSGKPHILGWICFSLVSSIIFVHYFTLISTFI